MKENTKNAEEEIVRPVVNKILFRNSQNKGEDIDINRNGYDLVCLMWGNTPFSIVANYLRNKTVTYFDVSESKNDNEIKSIKSFIRKPPHKKLLWLALGVTSTKDLAIFIYCNDNWGGDINNLKYLYDPGGINLDVGREWCIPNIGISHSSLSAPARASREGMYSKEPGVGNVTGLYWENNAFNSIDEIFAPYYDMPGNSYRVSSSSCSHWQRYSGSPNCSITEERLKTYWKNALVANARHKISLLLKHDRSPSGASMKNAFEFMNSFY